MLIPFDYLFDKYKIKTPGVLHLGANVGQEAEMYAKHGIPAVIWVEAAVELMPQLCREIHRHPGQFAFCACVSDLDGERVSFHIASNGGQSSSFLEFGTHAKEHPSVKFIKTVEMMTTRVDTLLKAYDVKVGPNWFLNIDLQGAELRALKGMGNLLWEFDYAYIEVNTRELYKGCPMVHEIDNYLRTFGFVGIETKMTSFSWGDKFYQRVK